MGFEGLPFSSTEEAVKELRDIGLKEKDAKDVAKILEAEAREDTENAKSLWENLKNKADAIIAGLGLETASFVGNPSQPSKFVLMKSDDGQWNSSSPILKEKAEDWEVVYAPAMQPSAVDKDGEVIPSEVIKNAAHNFLAEGKTDQIDADHNLITGKGKVVESWIAKEDKEYDLPNEEGSFKVEKGSWMLGVKPTEESKEKIESGEFTGFSIFGEAEKIELGQSFKMKQASNTDIEGDNMGEKDNEGDEVGLKDVADTVESVKESLSNLSEEVSEIKEDSEPEAKQVSTKEELQEALKEGEVIQLESDISLESKEPEMEDLSELMDWLEDNLNEENFSMVVDAVRGESEEMSEEEKEDGQEEKTAKGKGTDGEGLRKNELEDDGKTGGLNYQDRAEKSVSGKE